MNTREQIRLECIRLAHTHGRDSAEAVARAKVYEEYILASQPELLSEESANPKGKARSKKNVGNSADILS